MSKTTKDGLGASLATANVALTPAANCRWDHKGCSLDAFQTMHTGVWRSLKMHLSVCHRCGGSGGEKNANHAAIAAVDELLISHSGHITDASSLQLQIKMSSLLKYYSKCRKASDEQQSSRCKVRGRRSRSMHKGKDIYWKNIGRLEHLQMI